MKCKVFCLFVCFSNIHIGNIEVFFLDFRVLKCKILKKSLKKVDAVICCWISGWICVCEIFF